MRSALFAAVFTLVVAATPSVQARGQDRVEPPAPVPLTPSAPAGSSAAATPVKPRLQRLSLAGVDAASLADTDAVGPARQQAQLAAEGIRSDALDERPEVSSPRLKTSRFDAVGVSWDSTDAPSSPVVWVRVREPQGWSEWKLLDLSDIGPDADSEEGRAAAGRLVTEPLLTSGADAVQVRIDAAGGALRDVRAELIDAGRSQADGAPPPIAPAGHSSVHLSTAAAAFGAEVTAAAASGLPSGAPARPYVISRAQWGADESLVAEPPVYAPSVKVGVVHHTVTTNSYSPSGAYAEVRSIYAFHTLVQGFNDIGYNALVDRYGQIFEGRAGGLEKSVVPAAHAPFNTSTFAVSALGNYHEADAPPYMLESIAQILAWKLSINYVHPLGITTMMSRGFEGSQYPAGTFVNFDNISGHRDLYPTACPGQYLYADLDAIRNRVMQLTTAGLVDPAVTPTHRRPSANGSVRISSGMMYGGQWAVKVYRPNGSLLTYYTGSGGAVDATWPMTDGLLATPAAEGTYTFIIESNQNGAAALDYVGYASTSTPMGSFESVKLTPTGALASGWAAVSNGETATVAVVVDGTVLSRVSANGNRPDVASVYPELGANRGFSAALAMGPGTHLICAYGERPGLLSSLLGCTYFRNPGSEPFGNVDNVSPLYGGLRLQGWAIDRDTTSSIAVRFYVDGRYAGDAGATNARPDVGAAYPGFGANHGFDVSLNTAPGGHQVCVNGLNTGPGASEGLLRCVTAETRSGPPLGSLDSVVARPGSFTLSGWALDPDTTAPIDVHVYVDGAFAGAFRASDGRGDLAGPFPFMGTAHGYSLTIGASPGSHTLCMYAINAGPPAANPLLGCTQAAS
jgi:hypothetical protein